MVCRRIDCSCACGRNRTLSFRGALLRCVADEKLAALEQRYNLRIAYRELGMPSLSVIRLEGLTVVPEDYDTLLTLEKAEIDIDLLPLLRKRVSVHQVDVEGMKLSFVKQGNVSNYDFLFRQQTVSEADPGKVESVLAGYDVQVSKILSLVFRLLPENGELRNLSVTRAGTCCKQVFIFLSLYWQTVSLLLLFRWKRELLRENGK